MWTVDHDCLGKRSKLDIKVTETFNSYHLLLPKCPGLPPEHRWVSSTFQRAAAHIDAEARLGPGTSLVSLPLCKTEKGRESYELNVSEIDMYKLLKTYIYAEL